MVSVNNIMKQRRGGAKRRIRNYIVLGGCVSILISMIICLYIPQTIQVINSIQTSTNLEQMMYLPPHLLGSRLPEETDDPTATKHDNNENLIVYSKLRGDQSGWVIFDMLKAHAYCYALNITYGGACGKSYHKSDIEEVLESVGWNSFLPLQCPPAENSDPISTTSHQIYSSNRFQHKSGRRMGSEEWKTFVEQHTDYTYFGGNFDNSMANHSIGNNFSIVVHIRRRDVTPCCYPNWYLPNVYFTEMIDYYRQHHLDRKPQIHIFSQSKSYETWDDFNSTSSSSSTVARSNNYHLHLDGPVGEVWKAILAADVFIGSISEFSRVPSLFALGHIVNPRNIVDSTIRHKTNTTLQQLIDNCTDDELLQCKNKDVWKNKK